MQLLEDGNKPRQAEGQQGFSWFEALSYRVEATARDRLTRLKLTHLNSTTGFVG